jgi:hypothetical protein
MYIASGSRAGGLDLPALKFKGMDWTVHLHFFSLLCFISEKLPGMWASIQD